MKFSKTLGGKRGDENREVLFGHLIFKSGKTIILDEGEVREFENKIRLYKAEGKLGRPIKKDSDIMFICPDCSGNRLECCEDGHYNSEVFNIDEEGDFDYGEINASGEVDRF